MKPGSAGFVLMMSMAWPSLGRAGPTAADGRVELEVRGRARGVEGPSTTMTADEGRHLAGTQGDVLKSIGTFPGVARTSLGNGEPILWGAAPEESRAFVDGIEVPYLFHGGALRSVVASELVQSVTVIPGAPPADVGRLLGGVVRVKTVPLAAERVGGHLAVDPLDAGASMHAPLGDRGQAMVAARKGWIDAVVPALGSITGALAPADDRGSPRLDPFDVVALPSYHDVQAKLSASLRDREELSIVWLHAGDEVRRRIPSSDPTATRRETRTRGFHRVAVRWTKTGREVADAVVWVGTDVDRRTSRFGPREALLDVPTFVYGARASHQLPIAAWLTLRVGLDALGTVAETTRFGSLARPPREGDVVAFGESLSSDVARETQRAHLLAVAPYADVTWARGPVSFVAGVRAEGVVIDVERVRPTPPGRPPIGEGRAMASLDPRLLAVWHVGGPLTLRAAMAWSHQPPRVEDLGPLFGNPGLEPSSAFHVTVGSILRLPWGISAELTGFHRAFEGLAMRSADRAPAVGQILMATGAGEAWGTQIQVRRRIARGLGGMIAWTISRSVRRDRPEAPTRPFDHDQPHVLSAVLSQTLGAWTVGARWRFASGFPRTRVVGAVYDARADAWEPVHGTHNADRLPTFVQLDVRVDRAFRWRDLELEASLELQNVTFSQNVEEYAWSSDWSVRGAVHGLPPLVLIGARVSR